MKKGFTLVELLAAIVILAVIAVASIPVVTNVINSGKESAVENSVSFYIKELESTFSEWTVEGLPYDPDDAFDAKLGDTSESGYITFDVIKLNEILDLEGMAPKSGTIKVDNDYSLDNQFYGYVTYAKLEFENNYVAEYTYNRETSYKGNRANIEVTKK